MGTFGLGDGSLRMDDVYLEGATPDGTAVVGHLSVIVDAEGMTVLGPDPGARRTLGWDRMSSMEFGVPATLPGGRPGTSLQFALDGRPLRLLVPTPGSPTDDPGVDEVDAGPTPPEPMAGEPAMAEPTVVADSVIVSTTPLVTEPQAAEPVALTATDSVIVEVEVPAPVETPAPVEVPAPVEMALVEARTEEPSATEEPPPTAPEPTDLLAAESAVAEAPVEEALVEEALVEEVSVEEAVVEEASVEEVSVEEVSVEEALVEEASVEEALVEDPVGDGAGDAAGADDEVLPPLPRTLWRPAAHRMQRRLRIVFPPLERVRRLTLVTILVGLLPMAAGVWYFQMQGSVWRAPGTSLSDGAIAGRVGIQPGDLVGWSADAPRMGNPFAAGATTHGVAAAHTAALASTVLARCLHVSVSALDGAFGMGSAGEQRSAQVTSPGYGDPGGNGGSVGSVVDVVNSAQIQQADASVFRDPALFATCYQPFVQAMLPYAPRNGVGSPFATATVQPVVVPVTVGPDDFQVAAFQIARIANDNGQTATVVTTAVAVSAGRVLATLGTVDNFVFPLDAASQLVLNTEVRVIGVSQL